MPLWSKPETLTGGKRAVKKFGSPASRRRRTQGGTGPPKCPIPASGHKKRPATPWGTGRLSKLCLVQAKPGRSLLGFFSRSSRSGFSSSVCTSSGASFSTGFGAGFHASFHASFGAFSGRSFHGFFSRSFSGFFGRSFSSFFRSACCESKEASGGENRAQLKNGLHGTFPLRCGNKSPRFIDTLGTLARHISCTGAGRTRRKARPLSPAPLGTVHIAGLIGAEKRIKY